MDLPHARGHVYRCKLTDRLLSPEEIENMPLPDPLMGWYAYCAWMFHDETLETLEELHARMNKAEAWAVIMHGEKRHGWDWDILYEMGDFPCAFRYCWVCKSLMLATPAATKRHCDTDIHRAYMDRFCFSSCPAAIGPSESVPRPAPADGPECEIDFSSWTPEEIKEANDSIARATQMAVQEASQLASLDPVVDQAREFVAKQEEMFEMKRKAIVAADLTRRVAELAVVPSEQRGLISNSESKILYEEMRAAGLNIETDPILAMYSRLSLEDQGVLLKMEFDTLEDGVVAGMLRMHL